MAIQQPIMVQIAPGELMDKITILQIKEGRITDPAKLHNVGRELSTLEQARDASIKPSEDLARLCGELKQVNERLWEIEDDIRQCERVQDFGPRFVELARSVYRQNDHRAELKRQISLLLGATFLEEKSYQAY